MYSSNALQSCLTCHAMNSLLTIAGGILIVVTMLDFLFTTLSCNGSGILSRMLNRGLARMLVPHGNGMRRWNGVIHLIVNLLFWINLLLIGGFLVYYSQDDMVVQASTKVPADISDRIYFTGFVFSTLGIGDYIPGTALSEYFTAFYSLLGFGVLTTAISFILSVMNATKVKKNLSTYIASMGTNPEELFDFFTTKDDGVYFTSTTDTLVQLINSHTNDHLCYPIVHFFLSDNRTLSAVIQLASLYECTHALRERYAGSIDVMTHLDRLRKSLQLFLGVAYTDGHFSQKEEAHLLGLRHRYFESVLTQPFRKLDHGDGGERFGNILRGAGYEWDSVYQVDQRK